MYLAMVWNRVDIAEEKIFSNRELAWQEGELDMVMTKALLMEREAFVELLILNGFSVHKFLTVKVGSVTCQCEVNLSAAEAAGAVQRGSRHTLAPDGADSPVRGPLHLHLPEDHPQVQTVTTLSCSSMMPAGTCCS